MGFQKDDDRSAFFAVCAIFYAGIAFFGATVISAYLEGPLSNPVVYVFWPLIMVIEAGKALWHYLAAQF